MRNKCYYCGQELKAGSTKCPNCRRNQNKYHKLLEKSDELYNDGLQKARVHDLSGAIVSLRESLKNNKYNTEARNLLGLIFYARGNYVDAISEWVISNSLEEENNRAEYYLKEIKHPGTMDKVENNIERYNRALDFCREGSLDLAKVQLKRINNSEHKDMDAYRLLTLIYLTEKNYSEAKKTIKAAQAIDVNDTVILRYKKELADVQKDKNSRKKKKADIVNFSDGNDSVIMTRAAFRDFSDGSRTVIINIVTGIILGVLFCYFLIIPTIQQNARNKAANSIVDANESASNSANSVSELKNQVKSLQKELEKYSAKSDTVTSYEQLLAAKEALDSGDLTSAGNQIANINPDLLSEKAKALYANINAAVNNETLVQTMAAARNAYGSGDYQGAVDNFNKVISLQENYEDGKALFELAQSYEKLNDFDNAIKYYNRVNELYPDTSLGRRAVRASEKATKAKEAANP